MAPVCRRHLFLAFVTALVVAALPAPASAATTCDYVAAAGGDDDAAGTANAPFATPGRLANALAEGQTGCVRGAVDGNMWISASGATITSEPGRRGRLVGQVVIDSDARGVTVSDIDIDGTDLTKPTTIVLGDDALIRGIDLTTRNTPGICMILGTSGHDGNHLAERTRIEASRIHDCGVTNNHQHGIYVEHAADTKIVGNEIYDNADRGIQLYPDAQNTLIAGNVLDGNGENIVISGYERTATSGTRVVGNILSNPSIRASVESWFPGPQGRDNLVTRNCVFGGRDGIDESGGGFVARDNVVESPGYANRAAKDFRPAEGSRCAALLAEGRGGPAADLAPAPVTPAGAPAVTPAMDPASLRIGVLEVKGDEGPARKVIVHIHSLERMPQRTYARVEMRYRGRGWRLVGIKRVRWGRPSALGVRVPRRARKLAVRATLLKPSGREVVTFRAKSS